MNPHGNDPAQGLDTSELKAQEFLEPAQRALGCRDGREGARPSEGGEHPKTHQAAPEISQLVLHPRAQTPH